MPGLTRECREFLARYIIDHAHHQDAAHVAREYIESLLTDFEHVTLARTKAIDSVRAKLRKKRYPNPAVELTDAIGVRVISYYQDDVTRIADRIKESCEIDHARSEDKRGALAPHEFGYRSFHLVARARRGITLTPRYASIAGRWFEVQIRSILEHAWAEIDHEVRYKSGIDYPDHVRRRFAAMAGALEILDHEFLDLRGVRGDLIEGYRMRYDNGQDGRRHFDVARLLGFLEARHPNGLSWRAAAQTGHPFAARVETSCLEALRAVGLDQADTFTAGMSSRAARAALRFLAAAHGKSVDTLSHLSVVVAVVVVENPSLVEAHFPEMTYEPSVGALINLNRLVPAAGSGVLDLCLGAEGSR